MKTQAAISALFLALVATASITAVAADAKEEMPTVAAVAPAQKDEKAGAPQASASAPALKKHAAQDRSKHYHPRDGK